MGVFVAKKWKMGVFCRKVENGGVFIKKVENEGCFFVKKSGKRGRGCKKVDLSSTQGALCTVSVFFYFTFYLFGGCVHTQRTSTGLMGVIINLHDPKEGREP